MAAHDITHRDYHTYNDRVVVRPPPAIIITTVASSSDIGIQPVSYVPMEMLHDV